ncbi:DMT family transporter [Lentilactobacillus farraginis]|uniref:DMT family transporter n=1 Tax=Lentilactobacillus farraginis TaxID=390841 RepID=UPI0007049A15|nr:EamA family transporter [Lentilactobacillus farraginis]
MRNSKVKGIVLAISGPLLWGISGTTAQALFTSETVSANWLVSVRMLISGVLLVIYGLITEHKQSLTVWSNWRDAIYLIFFSFIGMAASQYTYFKAIDYGNAATATILQFLSPAIIIVYLAFSTRNWPRRVDILSLGMALTGTILLVTHGQLTTLAIPMKGLSWGLLTAVSATLYTLLPRTLLAKYGSIPIVGWSMLIGGVAFSGYYKIWRHLPVFSWESYARIGFVVIFGTMLAYLFFLGSLQFIMATTASVLGCFEPLSATFLSVIFLGVQFGLPETVGAVLIIGTVFVQSWATMRGTAGTRKS